jgi:isopenicillin N synthase-like dioxygenase
MVTCQVRDTGAVARPGIPTVPTIDVSAPADAAGSTIAAACRDLGFFQIVGHDLDRDVVDAAWEEAIRFFDLPVEDKLAVRIPPGDAYGYAPFLGERLAASLGTTSPPDLKETFSSGPFDQPPAAREDASSRFVYSPNRWPAALPSMRPAWERYYDAMAALAERLLALMAVGLDLPPAYFRPFVDRHTSALRALRYPALDGRAPEGGQLRAGAHTDYGTLTILRQDLGPGGLEVLAADGRWAPVPPQRNAFVVNLGDALARWSNDRWRSTLHRVVVPTDGGRTARHSLAFFHNANWDAVIECLPTCATADDPPRHPPVTAGRHLMEKFLATQDS